MPETPTNRLAGAASPYLLAHADDPVAWQEWGDEALAEARRRDVPIFLSVGYSACHWCHVMARESFADPATAAMINDGFVPVKVDREERPDVDRVYLDAVTALTGRAGWPLTAFLTPDGEPFFGGTYFPRVARHGLPSFGDVLHAVQQAWEGRRGEVAAAAAQLTRLLLSPRAHPDGMPGPELLPASYRALAASFDAEFGGFGEAPKFPQAASLEFLLRAAGADWAPQAAEMAQATLVAMADGGLHDQVGGGFARYAVDRAWRIPHFEKMLYDNALLARLYARGAQVIGDARLAEVARRTYDYLLADLALPTGGFASAEDADSEGEEGRFYTFTWEEFRAAAGRAAPLAAAVLGATPEGGFEGRNVLRRARPAARVAADMQAAPAEVEQAVAATLESLRALRAGRVRPARDDKAVAAWNGLAIRSLVEGSTVLGEPRYLEAAEAAARFVLAELRRPDGRLLRARRAGRGEVPAFCDDYAAMALAGFALFRATGDPGWFADASRLVQEMEELFDDPETGAFFSVGRDAKAPLTRTVSLTDHPTPSDNALAAEALLALAGYSGASRFLDRARAVLAAAGGLLDRAPAAAPYMAGVLAAALAPSWELVVVGPPSDPATGALVAAAEEGFRPHMTLARGDGRRAGGVPLLESRGLIHGRPAAYLCRDFACEAPITDPGALRHLLERRIPVARRGA